MSVMSVDSKFENDMLNKYEDQTFILNKDVESSMTKISEARTQLIFMKKECQDLVMVLNHN